MSFVSCTAPFVGRTLAPDPQPMSWLVLVRVAFIIVWSHFATRERGWRARRLACGDIVEVNA